MNQMTIYVAHYYLCSFTDTLIKDCPAAGELRILRVFSKTIERKEFCGPFFNEDLFRPGKTDTKCQGHHKPYALHHKIRQRNHTIRQMEKEFTEMCSKGEMPSGAMIQKYIALVHKTELEVLQEGADIILCTCNEASSERLRRSIRPVYSIIDECAMANEPECMVPICRAENVILIGDHQQLQPVIQYREAEDMGLGKSLFERYVQRVTPHLLQTQYRMVIKQYTTTYSQLLASIQ